MKNGKWKMPCSFRQGPCYELSSKRDKDYTGGAASVALLFYGEGLSGYCDSAFAAAGAEVGRHGITHRTRADACAGRRDRYPSGVRDSLTGAAILQGNSDRAGTAA